MSLQDGEMYDEDWDEGYSMPFSEDDEDRPDPGGVLGKDHQQLHRSFKHHPCNSNFRAFRFSNHVPASKIILSSY